MRTFPIPGYYPVESVESNYSALRWGYVWIGIPVLLWLLLVTIGGWRYPPLWLVAAAVVFETSIVVRSPSRFRVDDGTLVVQWFWGKTESVPLAEGIWLDATSFDRSFHCTNLCTSRGSRYRVWPDSLLNQAELWQVLGL